MTHTCAGVVTLRCLGRWPPLDWNHPSRCMASKRKRGPGPQPPPPLPPKGPLCRSEARGGVAGSGGGASRHRQAAPHPVRARARVAAPRLAYAGKLGVFDEPPALLNGVRPPLTVDCGCLGPAYLFPYPSSLVQHRSTPQPATAPTRATAPMCPQAPQARARRGREPLCQPPPGAALPLRPHGPPGQGRVQRGAQGGAGPSAHGIVAALPEGLSNCDSSAGLDTVLSDTTINEASCLMLAERSSIVSWVSLNKAACSCCCACLPGLSSLSAGCKATCSAKQSAPPAPTRQAFDLTSLATVAVKVHQLNSAWAEAKKASYVRHAVREYSIHKALRWAGQPLVNAWSNLSSLLIDPRLCSARQSCSCALRAGLLYC